MFAFNIASVVTLKSFAVKAAPANSALIRVDSVPLVPNSFEIPTTDLLPAISAVPIAARTAWANFAEPAISLKFPFNTPDNVPDLSNLSN